MLIIILYEEEYVSEMMAGGAAPVARPDHQSARDVSRRPLFCVGSSLSGNQIKTPAPTHQDTNQHVP